MNIAIQSIVNAKVKHTSSISFQSIPSSSTRMRLSDDRVILNKKIKPFEIISFNVNDITFHMICCPSGAFTMGADDQNDNPKRTERIRHLFLLGETEVTQELYQAVMGYNPSAFKENGAKKPVENVTWFDAVMFCNKLSQLLGKTSYYLISNIAFKKNSRGIKTDNIESANVQTIPNANGFRLPTEKEREYAAKAGTENKWAGCDTKDDLTYYAWFNKNSDKKTHPVKTKLPNEWGFYDMTGNVSDWCWDQYYSSSANRVRRGGSWGNEAEGLRSAFRGFSSSGRLDDDIGFRVSASL